MPFYEYECQACKYYTEVMQKISDPPLRKCPSCSKLKLKKLVSAPVFRLKGGGWYETDFKSDKESKRNLAGAEADSAASESKSDSTKTADAKGDSKTPESKPAESGKSESSKAEPKGGDAKGGESKGESRRVRTKSSAPAAKPVVRAKSKPPTKSKSKAPARKARR